MNIEKNYKEDRMNEWNFYSDILALLLSAVLHLGQFEAIRPIMIYFQTRQHQTAHNNEGLTAVSACASLILHNKSTKAATETKGFILNTFNTSPGLGAAPGRRAQFAPSGAPVIGPEELKKREQPPGSRDKEEGREEEDGEEWVTKTPWMKCVREWQEDKFFVRRIFTAVSESDRKSSWRRNTWPKNSWGTNEKRELLQFHASSTCIAEKSWCVSKCKN